MFGQKCRYLIINGQYLGSVLIADLHYIIPIKRQDIPLGLIRRRKTLSAFYKCVNALGHPAHYHILFEQQHSLLVQAFCQGFLLSKTLPDICEDLFLAQGRTEFFEIHRIHGDFSFLRWNDDVADIFPNGNQRSGFYIIISAISHQCLDSFPGPWKSLYLIKNHQRLPVIQSNSKLGLEQHKECIQIVKVLVEVISDFASNLAEVYQHIGSIFLFSKILDYRRLSHTPCALDQQRPGTLCILFPLKKSLVHLSLENHGLSTSVTYIIHLIPQSATFFSFNIPPKRKVYYAVFRPYAQSNMRPKPGQSAKYELFAEMLIMS